VDHLIHCSHLHYYRIKLIFSRHNTLKTMTAVEEHGVNIYEVELLMSPFYIKYFSILLYIQAWLSLICLRNAFLKCLLQMFIFLWNIIILYACMSLGVSVLHLAAPYLWLRLASQKCCNIPLSISSTGVLHNLFSPVPHLNLSKTNFAPQKGGTKLYTAINMYLHINPCPIRAQAYENKT
jgi:hypothetical protein